MTLTEKEQKILKTFEIVIPLLNANEKEHLLYIVEGMGIKSGLTLEEIGFAKKAEKEKIL